MVLPSVKARNAWFVGLALVVLVSILARFKETGKRDGIERGPDALKSASAQRPSDATLPESAITTSVDAAKSSPSSKASRQRIPAHTLPVEQRPPRCVVVNELGEPLADVDVTWGSPPIKRTTNALGQVPWDDVSIGGFDGLLTFERAGARPLAVWNLDTLPREVVFPTLPMIEVELVGLEPATSLESMRIECNDWVIKGALPDVFQHVRRLGPTHWSLGWPQSIQPLFSATLVLQGRDAAGEFERRFWVGWLTQQTERIELDFTNGNKTSGITFEFVNPNGTRLAGLELAMRSIYGVQTGTTDANGEWPVDLPEFGDRTPVNGGVGVVVTLDASWSYAWPIRGDLVADDRIRVHVKQPNAVTCKVKGVSKSALEVALGPLPFSGIDWAPGPEWFAERMQWLPVPSTGVVPLEAGLVGEFTACFLRDAGTQAILDVADVDDGQTLVELNVEPPIPISVEFTGLPIDEGKRPARLVCVASSYGPWSLGSSKVIPFEVSGQAPKTSLEIPQGDYRLEALERGEWMAVGQISVTRIEGRPLPEFVYSFPWPASAQCEVVVTLNGTKRVPARLLFCDGDLDDLLTSSVTVREVLVPKNGGRISIPSNWNREWLAICLDLESETLRPNTGPIHQGMQCDSVHFQHVPIAGSVASGSIAIDLQVGRLVLDRDSIDPSSQWGQLHFDSPKATLPVKELRLGDSSASLDRLVPAGTYEWFQWVEGVGNVRTGAVTVRAGETTHWRLPPIEESYVHLDLFGPRLDGIRTRIRFEPLRRPEGDSTRAIVKDWRFSRIDQWAHPVFKLSPGDWSVQVAPILEGEETWIKEPVEFRIAVGEWLDFGPHELLKSE